jgi:vacuolar-type H+-ATPase subunit I/STV1
MHCYRILALAEIDPGSVIVALLVMAVFGKIFGPHGKIR